MDHDQILEMVKRVRKAYAEELKGKQHKIDMNKNGKLDAKDFEHLRKMKEEAEEVEEGMSHQAKTTMKHIKNPTQGEKDASKKMKSGIPGYRDRIAMLHSAAARGALKKEEVDLDEEQLDEIELKTAVSAYKKMSAGGNDMKGRTGMAGDQSDKLLAKMKKKWGDEKVNKAVREEADLDEAKAAPGSPFSKDYKSQMPDDQKTSTKTYHDVKKISTGTVYTKQSDAEGHSKGTGDDAAKKAETPVKRGRGRPVGSKSGARQAGSASKTDYRGFVTHTLNLPASK